jgi:hypothetical protein
MSFNSKTSYIDIAAVWSDRLRVDMKMHIDGYLKNLGGTTKKNRDVFASDMAKSISERVIDSVTELTKQSVEDHLEESIDHLDISESHKDMYKESIQVFVENGIIVIAFATDDFVIAGMENGAAGFSIKEAMLNVKCKISKAGNRYRTIPITNEDVNSPRGARLRERHPRVAEEQTLIQELLKDIKGRYRLKSEDVNEDTEEYTRVERFGRPVPGRRRTALVTERIRTFQNHAAFKKRKAPTFVGYTNFKTMTDKPGSAEWLHPGFVANNMVEEAAEWGTTVSIEIMSRILTQVKDELR